MLKVNHFYFPFIVAAMMTLLAGCSRQESAPVSAPPAPSVPAAAPTPAWLASTEGEYQGITAAVQGLKRGSTTVELKLVFVNHSRDYFSELSSYFYEGGGSVGSISAVHLLDEANNKKYLVLKDPEGRCICSRNIESPAPGSQRVVWAEFPIPPDDVQKIDIEIPHFPPLQDVQISR